MTTPQTYGNGAVPDGWRCVQLGEIADVVMGQSPPGYTVVDQELICDPREGLPFIQGNAEFGARFPTPLKWCLKPLKTAFPGDVLFSVRAPVGETNAVDRTLSIGRGLAAIRFSDVDQRFGWHAVDRSRRNLDRLAQGSTFPAINQTDLISLPILLPPLAEQRAIAGVLDSMDEAIERTEAVIAATETLRDSLLHELLTRGVPGWHTEWKDVPGIGTIPADWELVRLGEVAQINPRRPTLDCPPNAPVTFLPMAAIAENLAGIVERERRAFREVANGYTYFEENDVLFAKITPCLQNGKHALATGLAGTFGFGTTEFHVVRASSSIEPRFLFRELTRPANLEKCVRSFSGTAGQQRVHPEILSALQVRLPPLGEQRAISDALASVDKQVNVARAEVEALAQTKHALSQVLLSGRIRVVNVRQETNALLAAGDSKAYIAAEQYG